MNPGLAVKPPGAQGRVDPWRAVSPAMCCKSLNLSFQSLSREIATRHSSHGGEFGERIDSVKDAEHRLRRREHSGKSGIPDLQKMLASLTESTPPRQ
jgi:hypothetical protein